MNTNDGPGRVLDVFELARTGGVVEGELDLGSTDRLRSSLGPGAGTLAYRFEGRPDSRGRAAARLTLRGEVPLVCDRCGAVLRHRVEHRADFYFVREESELAGLPILVDEPEPLLAGRAFDLPALVEDEAILSLPISPRHEACPLPGERPDDGAADGGPGPFASLPDLLRRDH